MLKLILIVLLNCLFLPLYVIFFIIAFAFTYLPIFPVITAKKNVQERLHLHGLKNRLFVSIVALNYVLYFFEILFFDSLHLTHGSVPKNFNMVNFLCEIRKLYPSASARGFTYLAAHVANLEFHTLPIIEACKNLNQQGVIGLAKPSRSKFINKILTWHRVRPYVGMIWTDKNLFENMGKAIDDGYSLCLIADQKPKKNGVFIPFFGKPAAFPTTGVKFCMEKKSILIYAFAYRILPGWVRVQYECGKNLHLSLQDANTHQTADELAQNEMNHFVPWLENNIKKYPTQWCWDYRKWSREPK